MYWKPKQQILEIFVFFAAQVQQISVEPPSNIMLHQAGNGEHPVIPNIMSTSIALPVVQTGFIQQPGGE